MLCYRAAMLALAFMLFAPHPPTTMFITSSELMTRCRNITVLEPDGKGDSDALAGCIGFVTGIVDGATVASGHKANPYFPVCLPTAVTREQLVRVVLKYGDNHPEQLHLPAARLVIQALSEGFPCQD